MAKRKRLTPAQPDHFATRAPETKSTSPSGPGGPSGPGFNAPPIAQVAGDTATHAALTEVTGILEDARSQGRLIEALPLKAINVKYMLRDRILTNDEDMNSLMISLRARGQQTPIEVVALPDIVPLNAPPRPNYGLISGWRRLSALIKLYEETGEDRFATIKALIVTPDTAQDAYVAMVEENEIRVNLSLYERARIALHAAGEGIFPTPRHAVLALFEAAPRAKRSKISSFIGLVRGLDGVLLFPKAISEKFGLELVKGLENDPGLKKNLQDRLTYENPQTISDEMDILVEELRLSQRANMPPAAETESVAAPELDSDTDSNSGPETDSIAGIDRPPVSGLPYTRPDIVAPALWLRFDEGDNPRIELSGTGVDDALCRALKVWLAERFD
ncbi:MAG: hypothetical protein JKY32_08390 [Rhizobiales bacterium]|nr:hypothetical protein [Hyphomicrobiales bacterium]